MKYRTLKSICLWTRVALCSAMAASVGACAQGHWTEDNAFVLHDLGERLPPSDKTAAPQRLFFDSLYTTIDEVPGFAPHVEWLRFWPDGCVILQQRPFGDTSQPTATDGDDFTFGFLGRYACIGNEIQMDFGVPGSGGWDHLMWFGHIQNDSAIRIEQVQRTGHLFPWPPSPRHPVSKVYIPHRVGEMKRNPNW